MVVLPPHRKTLLEHKVYMEENRLRTRERSLPVDLKYLDLALPEACQARRFFRY